jgi:hypothetical protein
MGTIEANRYYICGAAANAADAAPSNRMSDSAASAEPEAQ